MGPICYQLWDEYWRDCRALPFRPWQIRGRHSIPSAQAERSLVGACGAGGNYCRRLRIGRCSSPTPCPKKCLQMVRQSHRCFPSPFPKCRKMPKMSGSVGTADWRRECFLARSSLSMLTILSLKYFKVLSLSTLSVLNSFILIKWRHCVLQAGQRPLNTLTFQATLSEPLCGASTTGLVARSVAAITPPPSLQYV